jgi:hypothetical protein
VAALLLPLLLLLLQDGSLGRLPSAISEFELLFLPLLA